VTVPVVGLVGVGRMGGSMARALAREGRSLVVHNRTPAKAQALVDELGEGQASVAATPADVARQADVILTMLADDAAVEGVFTQPDGLLAGARPGTVFVDLSTVMPSTILGLEARIRATGAGALDAPVSGSTATAESGQLTLMIGGTAGDLERARPALEPLAKTIVHVGGLGAGAAMKLAVNTVIFGLNEAVAEGLVLAERAGIDRQVAYDVLATSAVGAPYLGYKRNAFLDPDGTPTAFALDLAAKDLRLITALADAVGAAIPQSAINLDVIRAAAAGDRGGRDFATVAAHLRSLGEGSPG
jgi:3-hydroxyisobutyrate dehydrogenase/2-hydroxy-3-oxopropionate reductase